MSLPCRQVLLWATLGVVTLADAADTKTDVFEFDANILQQRGLSPETGTYFARAPRFRPGQQPVAVWLNGRNLGQQPALFDSAGALCLNADFLRAVGIERVPPQDVPDAEGPDCAAPADWLSRVDMQLVPATGTVHLTVPAELVRSEEAANPDRHGGLGAALNYQIFATDNRSSGNHSTFRLVSTEAGFNIDDWIVRSRQSLTQNDGRSAWAWSGAWLQRSFPSAQRRLQAGHISTADMLYGGLALTGLQWLPEETYRPSRRFPIEGMANGRSRVELRQGHVLIHTTFVPAGPFRLTDYPLQNASQDLEVRVIDEAGGQHTVVVPQTLLLLASEPAVQGGWTAAAGRLRDRTENRQIDTRPVVLGSYSFARSADWNHSAGALLAPGYRSLTVATQWRLSPQSNAYGQWVGTDDQYRNRQGFSTVAYVSATIQESFQVGLSTSLQTRKFSPLLEAVQVSAPAVNSSGIQSRLGVEMTVVSTWARGLSAGMTQDRSYSAPSSQTYHLGWGTSVLGASLQVGLSRSVSQIGSDAGAATASRQGVQAYVNLSFALGASSRSNSYIRSAGQSLQSGSAFHQRASETISWNVNVDQQSTGVPGQASSRNSAAAITVLPRYAAVGLGVSQGGDNFGSHAEMSGSVVATGDGVAFGIEQVQDTFGTVRLGDIAGIRVNGAGGSAWSGPGGLVAISSLPPFQQNRLEIWGPSLPVDVNVEYSVVPLKVARGAVVRIDMGAYRIRRILLTLSDTAGHPLPQGTAVLNAGDVAATVGRKGLALIEMRDGPSDLRAIFPGNGRCRIGAITLDDGPRRGPFETGRARCLEPEPATVGPR